MTTTKWTGKGAAPAPRAAKRAKWTGMVGLLAVALCAACSTPEPNDFGRAQAEARARQTENPGAGETPVPVEGLAKGTPEDVSKNYHTNQDTQIQEQRLRRQRDSSLTNLTGR